MATQRNFEIKNGLSVAGIERIASNGDITGNHLGTFGGTTVTRAAGTNNTQLASTAYVDVAITNLIDSSPGALNTLNELAAAINDDASFSTTITNSIATKLPLAGGTMSGNLAIGKEDPNITLTDSSTSRTLAMFVDNNNSVVRASGPLLLQVGSQSAITIDASRNITLAGTLASGAITSTGQVQGNSFRTHVGTDAGSQLCLFADASGHCFIAGHTLQFNVGPNNSRTTKFAINASGNSTFSGTVTATGVTVGNSNLGSNSSHFANLTINNNGYIGSANASTALQITTTGNAVFAGDISLAGNISLTGGGTIEAPSSSGSENLLLNAAGGIHLRIDSNGNSGDDQLFKVMKHTSALLFSVQENGYAEVASNLEVGGHLDCSGTAGRMSARVQDMFHIGSEPNGATTTRYGNSSSRTYTDGGSSGYQGYVWANENWFPQCYIPYSPNQVYRLSASIYQLTGSTATSGASSRHYLGVAGYDENFNFLSVDGIGTYQYILASNATVNTGNFLEVDVTLKGWQGSGQANGNKMDQGTVYIRPLWLANYQSAGGTAVLTGFTIMPAGTVADNDSNAGTNY